MSLSVFLLVCVCCSRTPSVCVSDGEGLRAVVRTSKETVCVFVCTSLLPMLLIESGADTS